jgi:hypothetical protein
LVSVLVLVTPLVLATSCGVFEPRENADPDQVSGGSDYVLPQEPEIVVSNLINVLRALDSGNYQDLFTEDFGFIPDREDVQFMDSYYGPGIYSGWDKRLETTVTDRLFDRVPVKDGIELTLVDTTVVRDTDEAYEVYHGYKLEILQDEWITYEGIARFYMRKDPSDNLWYIYLWEDSRLEGSTDSDNATWGLLKGEIRATT